MLPVITLALLPFLPQDTRLSQNDELVRAAKNPYDLARFIDSHLAFDWEVLWKALGTKGEFIQPCGRLSDGKKGCSTELITVLNPDQEILLVEAGAAPADIYIRFLKEKNGAWRFSGIQGAEIRNHPRRHEVDRSTGTPFLRISSQGVRGSGIDSEVEAWFDLTQTGFDPAFSFTVQGYVGWPNFGVGRKVSGYIQAGTNTINVMLQVKFSGADADGELDLGEASYSGVYSRLGPNQRFRVRDASAGRQPGSKISPADFEALADITSDISEEDIIRLDMTALTELASGKDISAKNRLAKLLSQLDDTPEVLKLKALLR
jgi:hypothetical protein